MTCSRAAKLSSAVRSGSARLPALYTTIRRSSSLAEVPPVRGALSVPPLQAARIANASGNAAANRPTFARTPSESANLDQVSVALLNRMVRTIPRGQGQQRARLLGLGLQEVDEPIVVQGFERRDGGAGL